MSIHITWNLSLLWASPSRLHILCFPFFLSSSSGMQRSDLKPFITTSTLSSTPLSQSLFSPFIIFQCEFKLISLSFSLSFVASNQSILLLLLPLTNHLFVPFPPRTPPPPRGANHLLGGLRTFSDKQARFGFLCSTDKATDRHSWSQLPAANRMGACGALWHQYKELEENCGKQKAFQITVKQRQKEEISFLWSKLKRVQQPHVSHVY